MTGSLTTLTVSACQGPPVSVAAPSSVRRYTTTFSGIENPLSEGGAWSHRGWMWTHVQKKDGRAYGTQTGSGGYDDSYAYLSGFPPDQQGEAVVFVSPSLTGAPHEAELLLRWADSPLSARGYECMFTSEGDIQIMRWNGPFGDFTEIGSDDGRHRRRLATGDVLKARVVGPVITCYVNNVRQAQAIDTTWKDGQPGIGFFKREAGANSDIAYARYTATAWEIVLSRRAPTGR